MNTIDTRIKITPELDKNKLETASKYIQSSLNEAVKGVDTTGNLVSSFAHGNYAGSIMQGARRFGGMFQNAANRAYNQEDAGISNPIISAAKALGPLGGVISIGAALGMAGNALADKYLNKLPELDSTNIAFGGENINKKTSRENSQNALDYWERLVNYSKGTGLNTSEFVNLATSLSKQGITDVDVAGDLAQRSAMWAQYTGGDASQITDFVGRLTRFGSKDALEDLNSAYGAARASGMQKDQFPEFLSGLERVIEDGISKGYVKSTKEVSETMVMFSKLSGDKETWKGELGAQKLMQINNGLSSATSLNSATDLLAYQAMSRFGKNIDLKSGLSNAQKILGDNYVKGEGGDWLNTIMLMEQGLNVDNFQSLKEGVESTYKGDRDSQIGAWKQISGLNWTGAVELYNMAQNKDLSKNDIDQKIEELKQDPKFRSDKIDYTEQLNNIEKKMVGLGQVPGQLKITGMETVISLLGILVKDEQAKVLKENSDKMASEMNNWDNSPIREATARTLNKGSMQERNAMQLFQDTYAMLTDEQKEKWKARNYDSNFDEKNVNWEKWAEKLAKDMADEKSDLNRELLVEPKKNVVTKSAAADTASKTALMRMRDSLNKRAKTKVADDDNLAYLIESNPTIKKLVERIEDNPYEIMKDTKWDFVKDDKGKIIDVNVDADKDHSKSKDRNMVSANDAILELILQELKTLNVEAKKPHEVKEAY